MTPELRSWAWNRALRVSKNPHYWKWRTATGGCWTFLMGPWPQHLAELDNALELAVETDAVGELRQVVHIADVAQLNELYDRIFPSPKKAVARPTIRVKITPKAATGRRFPTNREIYAAFKEIDSQEGSTGGRD